MRNKTASCCSMDTSFFNGQSFEMIIFQDLENIRPKLDVSVKRNQLIKINVEKAFQLRLLTLGRKGLTSCVGFSNIMHSVHATPYHPLS